MSYKAGAAYVGILPDFRGFHERIKSELRGMDGDFAAAGDRAGKRFMEGFKARVRAGDMPKATIRASADTKAADAKLKEVSRKRTAKIEVKTEFLKSRLLWGTLGAAALGPQLLGLGAGAAGAGIAFGAAAAGVSVFGAIAKTELTKVTKAQQALTKAQQAYAKATTPAARKKALADEAAATAGLTRSERDLGTQLTGLQGAWKRLSAAEAPALASALAPWFATARQDLGYIKPLFTDTAMAVHDLGRDAKDALAAPFWRTFFKDVGQTGGIALRGFGSALGKVADGFAHLFVTFKPDIDLIPGMINKWAGSFDRWASSYKRSGFDAFMSKTFSKGNVASLKGDLSALGTTFSNIAKATANLSPAAFLGLSKVLEILSKLSPGQIEAIGALYAVGKLTGGTSYAGILKKVLGGGAGKAAGGAEAAAEGGILSKLLGGKAALGIGSALAAAFLYGLSKIHNPNGTNWLQQGPGGPKGGWNNFGQAGRNLKNWFITDPANWLSSGKSAGDSFMTGLVARLAAGSRGRGPVLSDSGEVLAQQLLAGYRKSIQQGGKASGGWFGALTSSVKNAFGTMTKPLDAWKASLSRMPDRVTLKADITQLTAKLNRAKAELRDPDLTRTRRAAIEADIRQLQNRIAAAHRALNSLNGKVVSLAAIVNVQIATPGGAPLTTQQKIALGFQGFAAGTRYAPPGWAWTGERGPELMRFRGGESVLSHAASMAAMRQLAAIGTPAVRLPGMGGAAPGPITLRVRYDGPTGGAIGAIVRDLRYDIQATSGGDVQKHLGRGKART